MKQRGINYQQLHAGRYAKGMVKHLCTDGPAALIDQIIIGAVTEAELIQTPDSEFRFQGGLSLTGSELAARVNLKLRCRL